MSTPAHDACIPLGRPMVEYLTETRRWSSGGPLGVGGKREFIVFRSPPPPKMPNSEG